MGGQVLSQEELDLLLQGDAAGRDAGGDACDDGKPALSVSDRETLARIVDVSMKKSAESLSQLIKKPVRSNTPAVSETTWDNIIRDGIVSPEHIVTTVSFIEGLEHDNLFIIRIRDAEVIVDLMMGGKGKAVTGELDDLKMSAVGEAMNQMMGTSATALADIFDKKVVISTPTIKVVRGEEQVLSSSRNEKMVSVRIIFTMLLDEPVRTEIYQIIPIANALEMIRRAGREGMPMLDRAPAPQKSREAGQELMEKTISAQPVQFLPLEAGDSMKDDPVKQLESNRLELIYDVPLRFVVELGRTEKTLKEILDLGPGSVMGLEKLAGEPLDVLVNGKFIAKGEVIVIDENYGVRIKEILNSEERLGGIKSRG